MRRALLASRALSLPADRSLRAAARRIATLGLLLLGEGAYLGVRYDADAIRNVTRTWWGEFLPRVSILVPQVAIAAATVAALVGGKRLLEALARAAAQVRPKALVWTLLLAHAAAYAVFV
ncbi:MAG: hypothetical protein D6815_10960, partial [Candidatus Dadabacteria bacterium]